MGYALPNGATVRIQKTVGLTVDFTKISNSDEAIITLESGHGLVSGDVVIITSGWSTLNNIVAKIKESDTTSVTLGNIKTTDTKRFPAGEGKGSLTQIKEFEIIPQITEVSTEGGDQQYTQIQFLEDDKERSLPTIKAAKSQSMTMAHDSSLPVYEILQNYDYSGDIVALSMYVPKAKETRYWAAKVSFDPTPITAINEVETVKIGFTVESPAMVFYKD